MLLLVGRRLLGPIAFGRQAQFEVGVAGLLVDVVIGAVALGTLAVPGRDVDGDLDEGIRRRIGDVTDR